MSNKCFLFVYEEGKNYLSADPLKVYVAVAIPGVSLEKAVQNCKNDWVSNASVKADFFECHATKIFGVAYNTSSLMYPQCKYFETLDCAYYSEMKSAIRGTLFDVSADDLDKYSGKIPWGYVEQHRVFCCPL